MPTKVDPLDTYIENRNAEKATASRVSYDAHGREVDPATVAALNAAEDRQTATNEVRDYYEAAAREAADEAAEDQHRAAWSQAAWDEIAHTEAETRATEGEWAEEFKRELEHSHNDRLELREAARNREIERELEERRASLARFPRYGGAF